ncbi:HAD family hydrolase [Vibrio hepatarius]|uniref:HAD family hydrolase n=1 Tax=Vibrio hepatarius TaxID=171383 RepID=UPI001C085A9A|nr:HAD family phosphatase [Vibrio hepatarius]MBU2895790.1 HAD family phosphatase [Vibrio hepatarius]
MLPKYKGVLFDMDGTLIDSRQTIEQAWRHGASLADIQISKKDIDVHIHGRSGQYTLNHFFGHLPLTLQKKIKYEVDEYEETAKTPMISGAKLFLDHLKAQGTKVALVTGSWRARVDFILDLHSLRSYFDIIIDRDDVKEGKPNPEGFIKGAHSMGLSPSECLIFEDSHSGVLASKACNSPCIVVGHGVSMFTENVIENISDYSSLLGQ